MLRNKELERAENIDSSFEWFDLGFYRVRFVFGSWNLILVEPYSCWNLILVWNLVLVLIFSISLHGDFL